MNSNKRVVLYAPTIHQGGGFVLLKSLLLALKLYKNYVILDDRLPTSISLLLPMDYYRSKSGLLGRICAEYQLAKISRENDIVICFGSLPPLFSLRSKNIVLFVQNRLLCVNWQSSSMRGLHFACNLFIQKYMLKFFSRKVMRYVVQTSSMQVLLEHFFSKKIDIMVLAIADDVGKYSRAISYAGTDIIKKYDFIYVASGEAHKNHQKLFEAWVLLAKQNIYPVLCVTLSAKKFPELVRLLEQQQEKYNLKIENIGEVSHERVIEEYNNSCALIYPSLLESFGLPLLEARQQGLAITAAELDYVRDLVDPEQTFDPTSALSIYRAVKRFMNIPEELLPLASAQQFLDEIIQGNKI